MSAGLSSLLAKYKKLIKIKININQSLLTLLEQYLIKLGQH